MWLLKLLCHCYLRYGAVLVERKGLQVASSCCSKMKHLLYHISSSPGVVKICRDYHIVLDPRGGGDCIAEGNVLISVS